MRRPFFKLMLILIVMAHSTACQNTKTINNEVAYLKNFLKNPDYFNKYVFIKNYVPSVMKRKGFDYTDAYKASSAKDNYFFYEKLAIEQKQDPRYAGQSSFFRCVYINDAGLISHIIKRKISIDKTNFSELNIEQYPSANGITRLYDGEIIISEALVEKIISSKAITYLYFERDEGKEVMYKIDIENDICSDLIYNSQGEKIHENIPFYRAEFIYNANKNFVDLKIE